MSEKDDITCKCGKPMKQVDDAGMWECGCGRRVFRPADGTIEAVDGRLVFTPRPRSGDER